MPRYSLPADSERFVCPCGEASPPLAPVFVENMADAVGTPYPDVQGRKLSFAAGEVLHRVGDADDGIDVIEDGLVKLEQTAFDGTTMIVNLLGPGHVCGLEVLVAGFHQHTATALLPVTARRASRAAVEGLLPRRRLLEAWHVSLIRTQERFRDITVGTARQRTARLFLLLPADSEHRCRLFARNEVAAVLGVSRKTADTAIADLKKAGALREVSPGSFIRDDDLLSAAALV